MAQLRIERARAGRNVVRALREWWTAPGRRFALAFRFVLLLLLAFMGWHFWSSRQAARAELLAVGRLTNAQNARWSGDSLHPKVGDSLMVGRLKLEAGVAEIEFGSGARIAVEGPAQWVLTGSRSLELQQGRLAAEVPKRAAGFSVITPNAKLVDLGTRFGVSARVDQCQADVFEGAVELARAADVRQHWVLTPNMAMVVEPRGARTIAPSPETAYPQPARSVYVRPVNCGFDKKDFAVLGGVPGNFGVWSGPAFLLTGSAQGVYPNNGPGMLRFLPPRPARNGSQSHDSAVWQLIDLRPVKDLLSGGDAAVTAFAMFNRTAAPSAAEGFGLTVAAFRGPATEAASVWTKRNETALAMAYQELVSDDDPATWEKVEVSAKLPPDADFLVLELRAVCPTGMSAVAAFRGHFADLADVYLSLPMRASIASGFH